jgi:hypothetical protein
MGFVLLVVLLRLMLRRVWMADLLAALILGFGGLGVFGPGIYRDFAAVVFYSLAGLLWLWIFRRFGLLAIFVTWATLLATREASISLSGWYAARSLAVQLVPVSVAAWAVWVIVSDQRPGTDSAT